MERRSFFGTLFRIAAVFFSERAFGAITPKSLEERVNELRVWLKQHQGIQYSDEQLDKFFSDERFELLRNPSKYKKGRQRFMKNPERDAKDGRISYAEYRNSMKFNNYYNLNF